VTTGVGDSGFGDSGVERAGVEPAGVGLAETGMATAGTAKGTAADGIGEDASPGAAAAGDVATGPTATGTGAAGSSNRLSRGIWFTAPQAGHRPRRPAWRSGTASRSLQVVQTNRIIAMHCTVGPANRLPDRLARCRAAAIL
jgi:hypothetical protein